MRRRRARPPRLAALLHQQLVELRAATAVLAKAADLACAEWTFGNLATDGEIECDAAMTALDSACSDAWPLAGLATGAEDWRFLASRDPVRAAKWARSLTDDNIRQRYPRHVVEFGKVLREAFRAEADRRGIVRPLVAS